MHVNICHKQVDRIYVCHLKINHFIHSVSTVSIIIQTVGSDPASQQIVMLFRHVAEVYIQYFRIIMYVEKMHLTP